MRYARKGFSLASSGRLEVGVRIVCKRGMLAAYDWKSRDRWAADFKGLMDHITLIGATRLVKLQRHTSSLEKAAPSPKYTGKVGGSKKTRCSLYGPHSVHTDKGPLVSSKWSV